MSHLRGKAKMQSLSTEDTEPDEVRLFTERVVDGVLVQSYQSFSKAEFNKMCAEEVQRSDDENKSKIH